MVLDIIIIIALVAAFIKGFRQGIILGVFSFIGIIVGVAAAMKLSTVVADRLGEAISISQAWLPVLSFGVVFIAAVMLVRAGAALLQKSFEFSMMGWLNRIGGMLLYGMLYMMVLSVLFFYAEQINLISVETIAHSQLYSFIAPWGEKVIDGFGKLLPIFKNMFSQLQEFFEKIAADIA